jgi:hypothetical protein
MMCYDIYDGMTNVMLYIYTCHTYMTYMTYRLEKVLAPEEEKGGGMKHPWAS